jgi:hypothetical protein
MFGGMIKGLIATPTNSSASLIAISAEALAFASNLFPPARTAP